MLFFYSCPYVTKEKAKKPRERLLSFLIIVSTSLLDSVFCWGLISAIMFTELIYTYLSWKKEEKLMIGESEKSMSHVLVCIEFYENEYKFIP